MEIVVDIREVLNTSQFKQLTALAKSGKLEHKPIITILEQDSSQWERFYIKEYLAYAIEYVLSKHINS